MNTLEQRIYIQYTKSATKSFESFVDTLLKHDDVLSDAELITSMQRITKKMQTVMSKWDAKLARLSPIERNGYVSKSPSLTDTSSVSPASGDEVVCFKKPSRASLPPLGELNPKPGCSYDVSTTNYDEEKSIMMVFKDVDESLIIGAEGFYVEEVTAGFWRCKKCDVNNLPLSNLLDHINGKGHKKKIAMKTA